MFLKSNFFRSLGVFCVMFSLAALAFADTIRLKDGSVIKGKIVNFNGGKFTVAVGDGSRQRQLSFRADEIESIQFDAPQTQASYTPAYNPPIPSSTQSGGTTVITVGQNSQNSVQNTQTGVQNTQVPNPPVNVPKTAGKNNNPPPVPNPAKVQPILVNTKVLADNTSDGWSNTGWFVRKGQKIRIVGDGRVSLGNGRFATPAGIASLPDADKLMKSVATGALIAVIGDDNNDFIYVGMEREFVATRDGALFLGVNEGNLKDNSGAYDVRIEIDPQSGN